MWGWQSWTQINPIDLPEPAEADGLLETIVDADIPGKNYAPLGEVGGASS
jgi:hypothetical protein